MRAPTSTPAGLSEAEVALRRQRDGLNRVPPPRRTPAWRQLIAQMTHFFAAMLWVAAALAVLAGMASLGVAIVIIVILNGVFAFAQEHKADRAAAELNSMMPATTRVRRDGETTTVDVADLVRDDVLLIESGDRIGADLRLTESAGLSMDESLLTGESVPVHRDAGARARWRSSCTSSSSWWPRSRSRWARCSPRPHSPWIPPSRRRSCSVWV